MKKTMPTSEKIYTKLLQLYPTSYQKKFAEDMRLTFKDMLTDATPLAVWLTVIEELPVSLVNEHLSVLRGGEVKMKRNVIAGGVGVISTFILVIILTAFILPNPLTGEGNGPMSLGAWMGYLLSGIIVGIIAKKSNVITAIISGGVAWILYALIEIPNWVHYLGYAKYAMPLQPQMLLYYGRVLIAVVALMGIGGLIGKALKSFFKVK